MKKEEKKASVLAPGRLTADQAFGQEQDEFVLPDSVLEKHELAHELWLQYFDKDTPREKRKELRAKYNQVAKAANEQQQHAGLQILTESTQWIPKPQGKEVAKPQPSNPVSKPANSTAAKATTNAAPAKLTELGTGGGKIAEIIALHLAGKSKKEIIEAGYNKSTVNRQVGEYIKRQQEGGANV